MIKEKKVDCLDILGIKIPMFGRASGFIDKTIWEWGTEEHLGLCPEDDKQSYSFFLYDTSQFTKPFYLYCFPLFQ